MARVPGSSPSSKKTPKATKTASASTSKAALKSVKVTKSKPSGSREPVSPTVVKQESLHVKIPHTEEGKAFLAKLHELLRTSELPFKQVCSPSQTPVDPKSVALAASAPKGAGKKGGTTYALEMRLEQEGWPPY